MNVSLEITQCCGHIQKHSFATKFNVSRNIEDLNINKTTDDSKHKHTNKTSLQNVFQNIETHSLRDDGFRFRTEMEFKLNLTEKTQQNKRTLTLLFIVEHECSICGFYDFSITDDVQHNAFIRDWLDSLKRFVNQASIDFKLIGS